MRRLRQAGCAVAVLLLGALIGLAAVALHDLWWGLLLAALASLAVIGALPPRFWTLPPYAVGWWIPLLVAWQGRPEGDYALESAAAGYALIALAFVVLCVALVVATLRAPLPQRLRTSARGNAPRGAR